MKIVLRRRVLFSLILVVFFFSGGCYDLEGGLVFTEDGMAQVVVGVMADEIMGGDEARILAWQIDFLFPEVNLNYTRSISTRREDFSSYLTILWEMDGEIDLSESDYFSMKQRDDGTYEFTAQFPPILESVSAESKEDIALVFFVVLPGQIDMANTPHIDGSFVEWKISKEMLTKPVNLRAFTK